MNQNLLSKELDELFSAIALIKTNEEFYNFFEDLCTVSELKSMAHRFAVVRHLNSGMTYSEVGELTGASTATISRISKCLFKGANGYKTILKRMEEDGV